MDDELIPPPQKPDPLSWIETFTISDEEAAMISDPKFIYPGLIIGGHLIVIASKPNGGKTTIFLKISGDIVKAGCRVIYVNADIAGGDAKAFRDKAMRYGITPLFPDMKPSFSMRDVVEQLKITNQQDVDLSTTVWVFDTLKKMADVINKRSLKALLTLFRGLTAKGATIILLAHTNKYDGPDGKPVFEGTGDLRSDVDELIYLLPQKEPDGSMTVSAEPDKTRGHIERMTFKITPDRDVVRLGEFIDVAAAKRINSRLEVDRDVVERIVEAIQNGNGNCNQSNIVKHCRQHGVSKKKARDCLERYSTGEAQQWKAEKAGSNAWLYELVQP